MCEAKIVLVGRHEWMFVVVAVMNLMEQELVMDVEHDEFEECGDICLHFFAGYCWDPKS